MTIQFDIPEHLYKCLKKRIELNAATELDMLVDKGTVVEQEPKQGHWVSVRDNLPIFGVDVLICDLDGDVYISYLHTDGGWGYDKYGNKLKNIIAWQPLPKPYQSEVNK